MRRTLLSVLVAIVSFVVTAFVLVVGYTLVAGHSMGPSQGVRQPKPAQHVAQETAEPSSSPSDAQPSSSPTVPDDPSQPSGSPDASPSSGGSSAASSSRSTDGLLSQDFRELGIDDPTTAIDESLRSACDVVGGTVAGPVLCSDR